MTNDYIKAILRGELQPTDRDELIVVLRCAADLIDKLDLIEKSKEFARSDAINRFLENFDEE